MAEKKKVVAPKLFVVQTDNVIYKGQDLKFLTEKYWGLLPGQINKENCKVLNQMEVGDIVALKVAYENTAKIRAIGKITELQKHDGKVTVEWIRTGCNNLVVENNDFEKVMEGPFQSDDNNELIAATFKSLEVAYATNARNQANAKKSA